MTSRRPSGRKVLIATISALLLGITAATWVAEVPGNAEHLDFAPYYASALLVREGHAEAMYNPARQAEVLRAAGEGTPATVATALTPTAILLYVPLTVTPLWAASLLWSVLQGLLLLLAALIAIRAAPWPANITRATRVLTAAAVISGGGTLMLLGLNQWDGVAAAGLALTYADLRGGRDNRAMVWIALGVLAGKPHLAVGLALFLTARRPLSMIPAAVTAAGLCGLTLLAVPLVAVAQWWATVAHVNGAFPASSTIGMTGLAASLFGSGAISTILGYVMIAVTLSACIAIGRWARRDRPNPMLRSSIDPLFLGVTLLSLLAAPHVFPYDLVLLIPGLVGCLAWGAAADGPLPWPGRLTLATLGAWLVVTLICLEIVSPPGSYRPTALLPIVLLAFAAGCVAVSALRPGQSCLVRRRAGQHLPTPAEEDRYPDGEAEVRAARCV
jgi:Glycosyltransferase family 87